MTSVAKSGGLGYPLLKGQSDTPPDQSVAPSSQARYAFNSLKDRPSSEFAAFFQGKPRHDPWRGSVDSFPNRVPDKFWNLDPRQAALALAEANRTPIHRAKWKLALDDRNGLAPPESGWLLHDWGSSGCYSFSSHLFALRFGVPDPELTVIGYNSIGVVGRNPWADQPARNVRIIKLTEQEARFLADTVFWLNRVRTFSPDESDPLMPFATSSTADGRANLTLIPEGAAPREIASGIVWATSSISGRWDGDYSQHVFANLAEYLIAGSLPAKLGERWDVAPEIDRHSLVTPTKVRLAPRVGVDARQQLAETIAAILDRHSNDPVPAAVLERLVVAAGEEALTPLLPTLQSLSDALPPLDADDKEYADLEKRFGHHFGNALDTDEPEEHKNAYARLIEFRKNREFLPAAILRKPLADSIEKLRLAADPAALLGAAVGNGPQSRGALARLRTIDPDAWSSLLVNQFQEAELESRRTIFATLAAATPLAAEKLVANLTPEEHSRLIIEIAKFHEGNDVPAFAGDLPGLLSLVRDKDNDFIRRGQAMILLGGSELDPAMLAEFSDLLVAEIRQPQQGKYDMDTLDSAVTALAGLPGAAEHLDLITGLPGIVDRSFSAGLDAILKMTPDRLDRKDLLAGFIRPRFEKSKGMMDEIFMTALAHDLRSLAPDIAAYASESPVVADGDGADYSGGKLKSPVGQRYHVAREITALWMESDPDTLARMWIHLVAARPYHFALESRGPALRALAAERIRQLPGPQRREEIDAAIGLMQTPELHPITKLWLEELAR